MGAGKAQEGRENQNNSQNINHLACPRDARESRRVGRGWSASGLRVGHGLVRVGRSQLWPGREWVT